MKKLAIVFVSLCLVGCEENREGEIPFTVSQQKGCETLPVFTLGYDTHLSDEQVTTLCSCVIGGLNAEQVEQATLLAQGNEDSQLESFDENEFIKAMGSAIMGCQYIIDLYGFNPSRTNVDVPNFPWLINSANADSLTSNEKQIYLNSYLETLYFMAHSRSNPDQQADIRTLNSIRECSINTNESEEWNRNIAWGLGELLDKSLAHTYYERLTPLICKSYSNSDGSDIHGRVQFYSKLDWISFTKREKAIYLSGYLDTVGAMNEKMASMGYDDGYMAKHIKILNTYSTYRVLTYIEQKGIDNELPLPWSMAFGLGSAYKDIPSDPVEPGT